MNSNLDDQIDYLNLMYIVLENDLIRTEKKDYPKKK